MKRQRIGRVPETPSRQGTGVSLAMTEATTGGLALGAVRFSISGKGRCGQGVLFGNPPYLFFDSIVNMAY